MWNSLVSSAATALEKTGDVLTEKATASARKQQSEKAASEGAATAAAAAAAASAGDSDTADSAPPTPPSDGATTQTDGGSASSQPTPTAPGAPESTPAAASFSKLRESVTNLAKDEGKQREMLANFSKGWGSVVEATKSAVDATREVVEKEQTRLQATFSKGPYRRDPNLPLDVDALRDAEVVYITDRLITMGHPAMQSNTDGNVTPDRKLAAVGHLLDRRHGGRYMVWNLSEVEYDYSVLDDQVLTYQFPGSPSPPLGLMLKLLLSVESWLKSDKENVAVLHCLTGRGRTSTVLAAFLCWTGEAGFHDPNYALEYIARCKRLDVDTLTIPSQRRYASYFSNMLDGVRPSQPPLLLKRIIMSVAPKFGKRPPGEGKTGESDEIGCAPYLQIFKAGNLVFTTAASMSYSQSKDDLPFCVPSDGAISFPIETVVQGDILIRCRHLTRKGQRVSMFRAAFHTGYIPPKVMRLTKTQLDGACSDRRFPDDFFLDLIFEACDAEMASKHLLNAPKEEEEEAVAAMAVETAHNEAEARRSKGTVAGAASVTASAYDTMLHRDSRFWEVIGERRRENTKKMQSGEGASGEEGEGALEKAYFGPTIGRRRDFAPASGKDGDKSAESGSTGDKTSLELSDSKKKVIQAFSIGGEFDFLGDDDEEEGDSETAAAGGGSSSLDNTEKEAGPPSPPKKDDLMDALMAIDEDDDIDTPSPTAAHKRPPAKDETATEEETTATVTEEVTFDHGMDASQKPKQPISDLTTSEQKEGSTESEQSADKTNSTPASESVNVSAADNDVRAKEEGNATADAQAKADAATAPVVGSESGDDSALVDVANLDADLDADLAAAEDAVLDDDDDFDFDDDDDELEDLENFLTKL